MIVEFIGCTGTGKSTLISKVQKKVATRAEAVSSYAQVAVPLGLQSIQHPSARNLIQEIVSFPFFIRSLPRNQAFIAFNLRILAHQVNLPFFTINNLRSLERKLGVYEIIRRNGHDKIVLVDEGTILQAHHLFVFTDRLHTSEEITKFSRLLPLPDAVVYIRAPLEDLIRRSLQRPDPPRIMKKKYRPQNEKYIQRAVTLFEELAKTERIKNRVLIVDNPDSTENHQERLANQIAEFILNFQPTSIESYLPGLVAEG